MARRFLAFIITAFPVVAAAQAKPLVTPQDLAKWETLGRSQLSPDGAWLAWTITRGDQDGSLHLRGGARDTQVTIPFGQSPAFSNDSKWFAYLVGVSTKERERLTKEKKPVHSAFVARNLATGDTIAIAGVSTFAFAPTGGFISVTRYAESGKHVSDVLVLDLAKNTRLSFANVAEQAWSEVKPMLAFTVIVDGGNGVQLYDGASGAVRVLESSPSLYRALAWRDKSGALAVLRTSASREYADTAHTILAWNDAGAAGATPMTLDASAAGFPANMRIAEYRRPTWSDDGKTIYFGTQPRHAVADAIRKSDEKISDVEIWHVNDVRAIPQQRTSEARDLRATTIAAWHLDAGRVTPIGSDAMESETILDGDRFATETDRTPYAWGQKFGRPDEDLYAIDIASGTRRKLLEKVRHDFGADPTGRRVAWFDGKDFQVIDVATGARANVTEKLRASQKADFVDRDDDHPSDVPGPWGGPTWSTDGNTMYLYTDYDVWEVAPDGSGGRRLTDGAKDGVQYRLVALGARLDPFGFGGSARERSVDRSKPVWLSMYGKKTKKSGYAQLMTDGMVKRVVFEDAQVGTLAKADSTDRYSFVRQSFEDSPDVFVGGADLASAKQFTATNPFQKDYAWGKAELINFKSTLGVGLQGILYYPANYEPGRKYPMIVYTYELLSQGLHRYIVPRENDYYNANVFTQNGYFVLMPDMVFRPGQFGIDTQAAVDGAIQSVLARGLVDPKNIGHCGHSQGGYEAYFLATHSKLIKTVVAGAGITDMWSFAGQMHWSSVPEFDHWETGQFRMAVAPWEDPAAMNRNSPILAVNTMPAVSILQEIGGDDPTVDMRQGVEFWNYARRAGKQAVMLLYPGEGHGLGKRENAIDYERRILQWFGHYLKGEPAPKWITDGQSWLERKAVLDANKP
ncbi:MAG TPA: prolyl oligopeptidase family serine peptidase [Gemmatimonadaceae bacterium]|nr:prolyl oligopeptidase family serine peptidase [Gemmatimonadaceae bacterium]